MVFRFLVLLVAMSCISMSQFSLHRLDKNLALSKTEFAVAVAIRWHEACPDSENMADFCRFFDHRISVRSSCIHQSNLFDCIFFDLACTKTCLNG
jgi:hypothetical protein